MKRVKLIVAYDGTGYCGWQVQPNEITVEGVLNKHISELTGEDIKVIGASRTDSGVHALGNVAVFDTERKRQKMSVEHIGNGYVKICVSEEELENSIAGLSQLKPILQAQAMKGNGRNTKQGLIDAAELGKHFDTAIDAMTMLLAGFKEESEAQNEE